VRPDGIKIGNVRGYYFVQVAQTEAVEVIEALAF